MLSRSYPSHGFVIDFDEAQRLFENVRQESEDEIKIVKKTRADGTIPAT